MKNNIKKEPVKFREDGLYFQHFMLILSLSQISDYHHLNPLSTKTGVLKKKSDIHETNCTKINSKYTFFFEVHRSTVYIFVYKKSKSKVNYWLKRIYLNE